MTTILTSSRIQQLSNSPEIQQLRNQIIHHPTYGAIRELEQLKVFMQHHIFAVWDFMSLLKALQQQLTCTTIPWMPVGSAEVRYLINEIVAGEESDVDQHGERKSHFELYLEAMEQCGASRNEMDNFIIQIRAGRPIDEIIESAKIPASVKSFMEFTFEVIGTRKPHIIAAVFTFGREDLIPNMFHSIVEDMNMRFPNQVSIFKYYLDRHIEVDGEHHSQLALQMVAELCGEDDQKWKDVETYTKRALASRIELWNGVNSEITNASN